jgi:hypothetical protein
MLGVGSDVEWGAAAAHVPPDDLMITLYESPGENCDQT